MFLQSEKSTTTVLAQKIIKNNEISLCLLRLFVCVLFVPRTRTFEKCVFYVGWHHAIGVSLLSRTSAAWKCSKWCLLSRLEYGISNKCIPTILKICIPKWRLNVLERYQSLWNNVLRGYSGINVLYVWTHNRRKRKTGKRKRQRKWVRIFISINHRGLLTSSIRIQTQASLHLNLSRSTLGSHIICWTSVRILKLVAIDLNHI